MNSERNSTSDLNPIVLCAEEIFLYVNGGSVANDLTDAARAAMTPEELVDHYLDTADRARTNHLNPEKLPVLRAQLEDPNSWVRRAVAETETHIRGALKGQWLRTLLKPPAGAGAADNSASRGDPRVATERDLIVRAVRDAADRGRLAELSAERVLAEAGESASWLDSVPDRLIMSEPIAPVRGGPVERRKYLAEHHPVLAELMAHQNDAMRARLTELVPELAAEVERRLAEARGSTPGGLGA